MIRRARNVRAKRVIVVVKHVDILDHDHDHTHAKNAIVHAKSAIVHVINVDTLDPVLIHAKNVIVLAKNEIVHVRKNTPDRMSIDYPTMHLIHAIRATDLVCTGNLAIDTLIWYK